MTVPIGVDASKESAPHFSQPWQARAFAMVVRLHEAGLFTWREWADTLGEHIAAAPAAGDPDNGDTYYAHWLHALEAILTRKAAISADELQRTTHAWSRAALRTPHGSPIELRPQDFPD